MASTEVNVGDSLTTSIQDIRILRAIGNNSSRLSDARIAAAQTTRRVVGLMVDLVRTLPLDGYNSCRIVAVDATQAGSLAGTHSVEGGVLRIFPSLEVAQAWFPIARETISALGDPEARYVTGRSTAELSVVAQLLRAEHWR